MHHKACSRTARPQPYTGWTRCDSLWHLCNKGAAVEQRIEDRPGCRDAFAFPGARRGGVPALARGMKDSVASAAALSS